MTKPRDLISMSLKLSHVVAIDPPKQTIHTGVALEMLEPLQSPRYSQNANFSAHNTHIYMGAI